jgi:hypothetical protein
MEDIMKKILFVTFLTAGMLASAGNSALACCCFFGQDDDYGYENKVENITPSSGPVAIVVAEDVYVNYRYTEEQYQNLQNMLVANSPITLDGLDLCITNCFNWNPFGWNSKNESNNQYYNEIITKLKEDMYIDSCYFEGAIEYFIVYKQNDYKKLKTRLTEAGCCSLEEVSAIVWEKLGWNTSRIAQKSDYVLQADYAFQTVLERLKSDLQVDNTSFGSYYGFHEK